MERSPTLRDWGPITPDSALPGYSGPSTDTLVDQGDPTQYFTRDYYENLIVQFQSYLINLDQMAQTFTALQADPSISAADSAQLQAWLDSYNGKATELRAASVAINTIVDGANAFGVGLTRTTLPQTLSQFPPIVLLGVAAAVAVVSSMITWAAERITTGNQLTQQLNSLPADKRAAALQQLLTAQQQQSAGGVFSNIASIVKWVAIGVAVWFAYRAYQDFTGSHSGHHRAIEHEHEHEGDTVEA